MIATDTKFEDDEVSATNKISLRQEMQQCLMIFIATKIIKNIFAKMTFSDIMTMLGDKNSGFTRHFKINCKERHFILQMSFQGD